MIIGVAGRNGAGKGEFVHFLEARSFTALSLSDAIRRELADRGLEETRERMIETGQEMRRKGGPGALAQALVRQLLPDRNYAIDSIRHPVEVEILRHHAKATGHEFHLVWVDAKLETRFDRMVKRGRPGDPATLGDLEILEARERGSDDPNAQQLDAVEAMADFQLGNDGSLEEFQNQIQAWVGANLAFSRPDWDEYFMGIARVVASRSNCVKRKVAAVVTADKRIISTGYNGTPRGTTNCNEGGCPRCNDLAPGGTASGRVPLLARRGELDHPGGLSRRVAEGRHDLHHLLALPAVHQDDHQRRPLRGRLPVGLPARRGGPRAAGGGRDRDASDPPGLSRRGGDGPGANPRR